MVQGGTATLPELIGDRAAAFALAAALGMTAARLGLPPKNYRHHLAAMPYRTSVFITEHPLLLPPLTRRLNLDAEAGLQRKIQDVAKKGNLKDFFHVQEVPPEQKFKGAVFGLEGFDPFDASGQAEIVIRVGLHRNGMVLLKRAEGNEPVRLNAATAAMFDRELSVERYCLHSMQLTPPMELDDAAMEVIQWM
ncbi:MAG: hypothetical protein K9N21_00815 [Deltaproteobacteria bacterium]|nr:hypothetical protein [Deltaproteobacteria bacterium]